jgi:starvation-inducible outer membrane lipoprotein
MKPAIILASLLLSGCITLPKTGGPLTNHVLMTVDWRTCMTASRWGPISLTGDINESECEALRQAFRLLMLQQAVNEAQAKPKPAMRPAAGDL